MYSTKQSRRVRSNNKDCPGGTAAEMKWKFNSMLNRPSFLYPGYKIGDGQQQLQMIVSSRKRSDEQSAAEKAWKAQEPRALRRDGSEDLNRGDPSGQTWDEGGLSRRRNS